MKAKAKSTNKSAQTAKPSSARKKAVLRPPEPAPQPPVLMQTQVLHVPLWSEKDYAHAERVFTKLGVVTGQLEPSIRAQILALSSLLKLLPSASPPLWLDQALGDLDIEIRRVCGLHLQRSPPPTSGPSPPPVFR